MIEFKNKGEAGYEDAPINADNLNANFKEAEKHIICTGLSELYTLTQTGTYEQPTLVEKIKIGDKLSLVDNSIVIGAGVSIVKIDYNVHFQEVQDARARWVTVFKNGTTEAVAVVPFYTSMRGTLTKSGLLVQVSEGVTLQFKLIGATGDTIRNDVAYTSFTVEVVDFD